MHNIKQIYFERKLFAVTKGKVIQRLHKFENFAFSALLILLCQSACNFLNECKIILNTSAI